MVWNAECFFFGGGGGGGLEASPEAWKPFIEV